MCPQDLHLNAGDRVLRSDTSSYHCDHYAKYFVNLIDGGKVMSWTLFNTVS